MTDLDRKYKKCGSPGYIAPEILNSNGFHINSDIFSAGCLLSLILTGRNLFPGNTSEEVLFSNQRQSPLSLLNWRGLTCSEESKQLLIEMLSTNPYDRPLARKCLEVRSINIYSVTYRINGSTQIATLLTNLLRLLTHSVLCQQKLRKSLHSLFSKLYKRAGDLYKN